MGFDLKFASAQAAGNAIATLEAENCFSKVDEMDRLLGLASEDKMKGILAGLFEKYVSVFGEAVAFKGGNTQTSGSITNLMTRYCVYMGLNIVTNYKEADETKLAALFDFVTPYAGKIVVALETDSQPKSASQVEGMLKQCIDRFCAEFQNK